jgi:hypothetical protein
MPTSFTDSSSRLTGQVVDFLWHQWSSIGVAGYARVGDDRIIDPEALLLATTRFGRYDSRLMDESIDWLVKFGRRINLQRLQNLHREWPGVADPRVLAAISEVLGQQAVLRKWRVIADLAPEPNAPEALHLSRDGKPSSHSGAAEPFFGKYGLLRGKLEHRGMSQPPDPRSPGNLLFTLRALFGVNARAEIMAWLLTHNSGHPAAISRSTCYFSKSIQQTLNEMEESGQVLSVRQGREKLFRVRAQDWRFLATPAADDGTLKPSPRWVDWMPLFAAITRFAEALALPGIDEKSEHFQATKLREALDEAMPALIRAGISHELHTTRDFRGKNLVQSLLADIDSILG